MKICNILRAILKEFNSYETTRQRRYRGTIQHLHQRYLREETYLGSGETISRSNYVTLNIKVMKKKF